jgi:hypothetical protein
VVPSSRHDRLRSRMTPTWRPAQARPGVKPISPWNAKRARTQAEYGRFHGREDNQSGTARARPPPPWARPHRHQPSGPPGSARPTSAATSWHVAISWRAAFSCTATADSRAPDGVARRSSCAVVGHDGDEIIGRCCTIEPAIFCSSSSNQSVERLDGRDQLRALQNFAFRPRSVPTGGTAQASRTRARRAVLPCRREIETTMLCAQCLRRLDTSAQWCPS